jgi:hypothetical protein
MGWPKGKPRSPETIAKMRAGMMGKGHTAETRAKMSLSQTGRKITWADKISKTLMGHPVSDETIRKAKESRAKNPHPPVVFTPEIREKIRQSKLGEKNANWKGGITNSRKGYEFVRTGNFYVSKHRLVMEWTLGRKVQRGEVIHHINKNHRDNRPGNLALCSDAKAHQWCHREEAKIFLGNAAGLTGIGG